MSLICFFCTKPTNSSWGGTKIQLEHPTPPINSKISKDTQVPGPAPSASSGFSLFCHFLTIDPNVLTQILDSPNLWACGDCGTELGNLWNLVGVYNQVKVEIEESFRKIRSDIWKSVPVDDEVSDPLSAFRKEISLDFDPNNPQVNWNLLNRECLDGYGLYSVVNFLALTGNDRVIKLEPPETGNEDLDSHPLPLVYCNTKYEPLEETFGDDSEVGTRARKPRLAKLLQRQRTVNQRDRKRRPRNRQPLITRPLSPSGLTDNDEDVDENGDGDYVPTTRTSQNRRTSTPSSSGPPICPHCSKSFSRHAGLRYHLSSVHGEGEIERKFKCNECDKAFIKRSHLVGHQQVHTGERRYPCRVKGVNCEQRFRGHTSRKFHEQTAHGPDSKQKQPRNRDPKQIEQLPKPTSFPCGFCPKIFRQNSVKQRHELLVHSKKDSYPCEQCQEVFRSIYKLWDHKRTTHPKGVEILHCELCPGSQFKTWGRFRLHQREMHGDGKDEEPKLKAEAAGNEDLEGDDKCPSPVGGDDFGPEMYELNEFPGTSNTLQVEEQSEHLDTTPGTKWALRQRPRKIPKTKIGEDEESNGGDDADDPDFDANSAPNHTEDGEDETKPVRGRPRGPKRPKGAKRTLPPRIHPCPHEGCEMLFRSPNHAREHHHNIHARGYIQCTIPYCRRGLPSQEELQAHLIRHEKIAQKKLLKAAGIVGRQREPPQPIELVPKQRTRPPPPLKHKCTYCDKLFPWTSDRIRHENLVHHNLKSYLCESCGAAFKRNFQLWHHCRNVHKEHKYKEPVPCDQCPPGGKLYASQGWLEVHLRKFHGKEREPKKAYYYV